MQTKLVQLAGMACAVASGYFVVSELWGPAVYTLIIALELAEVTASS